MYRSWNVVMGLYRFLKSPLGNSLTNVVAFSTLLTHDFMRVIFMNFINLMQDSHLMLKCVLVILCFFRFSSLNFH